MKITIEPKLNVVNVWAIFMSLLSLWNLAGIKGIAASLIFVAIALMSTKLEVVEDSDERSNDDANAASESIGARRSKIQGNAELS